MRVMIGTPCYGGNVNVRYLTSLLATLRTVREAAEELGEIEIEIEMLSSESHVGRARNQIASRAMAGGFDALFFIDADIAWRPEDFLGEVLLATAQDGPDIIGGLYAIKRYEWGRVRALARAGVPAEELSRSSRWAGRFDPDSPTFDFGPHKFRPATHVPTGFMCIRGSFLRQLAEKHPELRYVDAADSETHDGVALFDSMIVDKHWLPEDFAFVRRAIDAGARVVALTSAELEHVGTAVFRPPAGAPLTLAEIAEHAEAAE